MKTGTDVKTEADLKYIPTMITDEGEFSGPVQVQEVQFLLNERRFIAWAFGISFVIFMSLASYIWNEPALSIQEGARRGDQRVVRGWLKRVDPDRPDRRGETALLVAARKGDFQMVDILLGGGATIDQQNLEAPCSEGNTALHTAVLGSATDMIPFLLERKASPNLKNRSGMTPFHLAVYTGNYRAVSLLFDTDPGPSVEDRRWDHLLAVAVEKGLPLEVIGRLLEKGYDINRGDGAGMTPLHFAARWKGVEMTKFLLEHGANPKLTNRNGLVPGELAFRTGNLSVAQLLEFTPEASTNGQLVFNPSTTR